LVYETKSGNQIGAIGLASATMAISCRDSFIGWDKEHRLKHLGMLANNSRFALIQKNITLKNAASMTLKQLREVGSKRWKEKYNQPLIMIETFVQPTRDEEYGGQKTRNGSCYLADNWIEIGYTRGNSIKKCPLLLWKKESGERGKLARENPKLAMKKYGNYNGNEYVVSKSPIKIIFIKPIVWNWKKILTSL
jgi:hypothetical protein